MTIHSVSVVIPICNELDNVSLLHEQLSQELKGLKQSYEIIFVDDGSTDGTLDKLYAISQEDVHSRLVVFRRNYGQTAAMQAGIDYASGDVIITMDGDLQNDPSDIPLFLEKIDDGYDLVHGWRRHRQDALLHRKLPSKIANWIISKTTGFPIHDLGCTLKAIRREIADDLELFGEMHRFIPIIAHERGAKCIEVETKHHARRFGTTKYGIGRTSRVILDLITVKYLLKYFASPMKLFGMIGLWCLVLGVVSGLTTVGLKLTSGFDMTGNPLLLLSAFSIVVAIQFMSLGLLGEVNARIYFGSQGKTHYALRDLVNFEQSQPGPQLSQRKVA